MNAMKGKLVFLKGAKDIEIRTYPLSDPEPGSIRVKVLRANICGSDVHVWAGEHPILKSDIALGHEAVFAIEKLGDGVDRDFAGAPVKPGDRIVAPYFRTCHHCAACKRGDFPNCLNAYGHLSNHPDTPPHFYGTLSTHSILFPYQYFFKVPDALDNYLVSSINCAMSTVYFALDRLGLQMGAYLVIQGAGGLGLHATAIASEKGAKIIVIDGIEERLHLAREFGARYTININESKTPEARIERIKTITGGELADCAIELVGKPAAVAEGLHYLHPGGRYAIVGNVSPFDTAELAPGLIVRNNLTVIGSLRYDPWYLFKCLQFLERYSERYPYNKFSERVYALEDVNQALEDSENHRVARPAIEP